MQENDTSALQRRMRMLAFAVHSQLLESEPLSKAEAARLERMIRDGLAPDEGIAVLKKTLGIADAQVSGSAVLKNIPGLDEAEQLAAFERNAVAWRSLSLPTGHYDVAHLKAIHKHLFQDVYGWAGEFRTIPMAKGASRFAQPQYIEQETRKILGRIAVAEMRTAPVDRFTAALAEMISELNAVHPFRKGNGRTIRAIALLLAEDCGYAFDLTAVTPALWTEASILAFQGNNHALEVLLHEALHPLPVPDQK